MELPFTIRNKKTGDRIESLVGTKKLSRIFIDNKIPSDKRDEIPVILDNNGNVLWVYDLIKSKSIYEQKNGELYFVCEVSYE